MSYTVSIRPGAPRGRVAVIFGIALFGLAVVLSSLLVWQRRQIELGERVQFPDWSVTFMPPARWGMHGPVAGGRRIEAYVFADPAAPKRGQVWVWRFSDVVDMDADELCRRAIMRHFQYFISKAKARGLALSAAPQPAMLGPLPGAEIVMERTGYMFIGVTVREADGGPAGYVLEYHADRPLRRRDIGICETVAASFAFAE